LTSTNADHLDCLPASTPPRAVLAKMPLRLHGPVAAAFSVSTAMGPLLVNGGHVVKSLRIDGHGLVRLVRGLNPRWIADATAQLHNPEALKSVAQH
jgi:hypothetical protein